MAQYARFPMKYLNITQKWGSGTHTYGYPIDIAGKDTGIDNAYAPFNCVVKKIWPNGNTVWFESTSKVKYANGVYDYATFSMTHDNAVADMKVGRKFKQGQVIYQEGTAGQATGNHIHFEVARGKFTGTGWYQAPNGQWVINNPYRPDKMLFITEKTVIKQTLGLKFKKEKHMLTVKMANIIMRFHRGKSATKAQRDKFVGKVTADQFEKLVAGNKEQVAYHEKLAKQGRLDMVNHLPLNLRNILK